MVASVYPTQNQPALTGQGIRPIDLRTDLAPLADLIELSFAETMDSGGRAALREMRTLSQISGSVALISRFSEAVIGVQNGYVWIEDGRLVGNVSIYPTSQRQHPHTWIIANVSTHPDYRRRGIARQLMLASLDGIRARGGKAAILQVDYDNTGAHQLYRQLGFVDERAWVVWRRARHTALYASPTYTDEPTESPRISHMRRAEWRALYALAGKVRPDERGGIGWLRPLHPREFRPSVWTQIDNLLNLRSIERLVIRSPDHRGILAYAMLERGFGVSTRITLMVDPRYAGVYDDALLRNITQRFKAEMLTMEHPRDEVITSHVIEKHGFRQYRSAYHMRLAL